MIPVDIFVAWTICSIVCLFFPAAIDIASRTHAHRRHCDIIASTKISFIIFEDSDRLRKKRK